MNSKSDKIKNSSLFKKVFASDLETRLGTIFVASGFLMSVLATILTIAYGYKIGIVLPNIIMALICVLIPVLSKNIKKSAYIALILVGLLYFPFVFSIAGGIKGPAPIYFIVIIAYTSLYYHDKSGIYLNVFLLLYFVLIVFLGDQFPQYVNNSNIDFLKSIDIVVSVVSVSIVISLISSFAFNGYKREYEMNHELMEELGKRNNELKVLSEMDQLTDVYNRRYFLESINREIEYCDSKQNSFYLLMIDLDGFKKINDSYGHLFGDTVLKAVSKEMKASVNESDIICRYGGEEFSIVISHMNKEEAFDIAERIRHNVENLKFKNNINVTLSIGASCFKEGDTLDTLINRADNNLYKAKENGKNCVVGC